MLIKLAKENLFFQKRPKARLGLFQLQCEHWVYSMFHFWISLPHNTWFGNNDRLIISHKTIVYGLLTNLTFQVTCSPQKEFTSNWQKSPTRKILYRFRQEKKNWKRNIIWRKMVKKQPLFRYICINYLRYNCIGLFIWLEETLVANRMPRDYFIYMQVRFGDKATVTY